MDAITFSWIECRYFCFLSKLFSPKFFFLIKVDRERQKEVKDFSTITSLLKKKKFYSLPKVFDAFILLDEEMKKRAKIKNWLIFGNFSSLSFH